MSLVVCLRVCCEIDLFACFVCRLFLFMFSVRFVTVVVFGVFVSLYVLSFVLFCVACFWCLCVYVACVLVLLFLFVRFKMCVCACVRSCACVLLSVCLLFMLLYWCVVWLCV